MATIPASHADLLKKAAFANLATLNADGSPQVTPVWVDFDGTHVLVNTARGRVKAKNLARESRVALSRRPKRAPTPTSTRWPGNTLAKTPIPSADPARYA